MERNQDAQNNNINVSDNDIISENSLDNQDFDNSNSDDESDTHSDDSPTEDDSNAQMFPCMFRALGLKESDKKIDELAWIHTCPMIVSTNIAKEMGVRMTKKYFESKA